MQGITSLKQVHFSLTDYFKAQCKLPLLCSLAFNKLAATCKQSLKSSMFTLDNFTVRRTFDLLI